MHTAGLAGEPFQRTGDGHRGDDLAGRGADRCGDRADTHFAFTDALGPAASAHGGQFCCREGGLEQTLVHAVGVFPREQDLSSRSGIHGELAANRDRVAEACGPVGGGDAYAEIALAAIKLSRFAGDVPQASEDRAGGGKESIFAGSGGELAKARAENEATLHIARYEPMMFKSDRKTMRGGSCESSARHESRKSCRPWFESGQDECGFVKNAHSARVVHVLILPYRIVRRKS